MKLNELFNNSFRALTANLGLKAVTLPGATPSLSTPLPERMLSDRSMFCQATVANGYLTPQQLQQAVKDYRLGITRDGGVLFWQIDEQQVVRDGKIMFYRPDCHRDHQRHPSWASSRLKQQHLLPADFCPQHCLFGLHLLAPLSPPEGGTIDPSASKTGVAPSGAERGSSLPIAVVEAEKTAVILSQHFPQQLWLASGGLTELTVAKLRPLQGRRVMLFPDTDPDGQAYRRWAEVAAAAADVLGHPVAVSDLLERRASAAQKAAKIDLVDFLFEN